MSGGMLVSAYIAIAAVILVKALIGRARGDAAAFDKFSRFGLWWSLGLFGLLAVVR